MERFKKYFDEGDDRYSLISSILDRITITNSNFNLDNVEIFDIEDHQVFQRDQKINYLLGNTSIVLKQIKYSFECNDFQDLRLYGFSTNQILMNIIGTIIPEISQYPSLYFPKNFLSWNMINGKNIVTFSLYIDNENKEI